MPALAANSLPALLLPMFQESPIRIRQEPLPLQIKITGVRPPASNICAPNRSIRCRIGSLCSHKWLESSQRLAACLLAGHDAANGLALRFTHTSTGKDLFKVPDFFGQFPLFQGPKPRPNYFRTVIVTARLDHLVDEVVPVVCQRCAHVLIVTNYCSF